MPSPYFINVDPDSHKLQMFFGRSQEIQTIWDCLMNGDSVLLIGERRIGKTFLLYMLGDFARQGPDACDQMLDRETGALLAQIRRSASSHRWVYVDMLTISSASGLYFRILTGIAAEQAERPTYSLTIDHATFLEELTKLSQELSGKGQRVVVLIDEGEKLLSIEESAQILSCLKAAVQQCNCTDFVLAGDFKSHHETPEFLSLRGALRTLYLGPLAPVDAGKLIEIPVAGQLSFEQPALHRLLELTGARPALIQIVCDHLYQFASLVPRGESAITLVDIDGWWESELRTKVFTSFAAPLNDFFDGLSGEERTIYAFLAHHPLASEDEIATAIHISLTSARRALQSLQTSRRVESQDHGYFIGAKLVEEFGSRFVTYPVALPTKPSPEAGADSERKGSSLKNEVRDTIEAVELRLRQLIAETFEQRGYADLEAALAKRHAEAYAHCQETRDRNRGAFKRHRAAKGENENILGYSTIGDLGSIIAKDWEFFRVVFDFRRGTSKDNKRYWTETMETVVEVRNALAHGRPVPENELRRAEVYCNDIMHALNS